VVGNVWRVFAESFEGIHNEVDTVVAAVFVLASDQVLTH
jgi:hypothetical protein